MKPMPKTEPTKRVDPEVALRELAAYVERYRAHNDKFERALVESHARWAARGLCK